MELKDHNNKLRSEYYILALMFKISESDLSRDMDEVKILKKMSISRKINPKLLKVSLEYSVDELINLIPVSILEDYRQTFVDVAKADGTVCDQEMKIFKLISDKICSK
jgi:hypothetical protein